MAHIHTAILRHVTFIHKYVQVQSNVRGYYECQSMQQRLSCERELKTHKDPQAVATKMNRATKHMIKMFPGFAWLALAHVTFEEGPAYYAFIMLCCSALEINLYTMIKNKNCQTIMLSICNFA